MSRQQRINAQRAARVEDAAAQLLYVAERWATTGATFFDLKCRRRNLLAAAREYGNAVRALAAGVR